jgi:hypothetical protein
MLQVFGHVGEGVLRPKRYPNIRLLPLYTSFFPQHFSPFFSKEDLRCAPRHGIDVPVSIQVSQDCQKQLF